MFFSAAAKQAPATTSAPAISPACPKCVKMKKSDELSCCVRGGAGAWFDKCSNPGDSEFEHTWGEGMQACKSFVDSVQSADQIVPRHATKQTQGNADREQKPIESADDVVVSNVYASNHIDCVNLSEIISLLCNLVCTHT